MKYWKTILVSVFIFYISIIHISSGMKMVFPFFQFPHFDKIVHFCIYFTLSTAVFFDFIYPYKSIIILLLLSWLLPTFYGGIIELLQEYYFPPRTGDWFDFLADSLGALVAAILFGNLFSKRKRLKNG